MPFYEICSFNICSDKIKILYHGIVDSSRRLEVLIRAVPLLDDRYVVEIRGPENKKYIDILKNIVSKLSIEDRVRFTPQVPFSKIISEANKADIGYEVVDGFSPQHQFMLPNKFFENTMAGLALCVSNFREMSRIIEKYHNGIGIETCTPEAVAKALNALYRDQINAMKKASLAAAKDLCWEKEEQKMLVAYHME
ncbi:glycosyltransferase [Desulfovibrio sp. ZJ369]|uniref:glycosyltransferase n=1 Tax=Desulfovibrio sp. ZJ369 TaxID=2709793 RepID=UPI00197D470C|nr:glycosyltransferase [Desulfovibrio sp. ZJ369]